MSANPSKQPVTNLDAAKSGIRRQALEVLRDTLARSMDECDPNMHAQLAGQYRATLAELAALPAQQGGTILDQLAAARKARLEPARRPGPRPGNRKVSN